MAERDLRDMNRAASLPLVASADAILLDTTGMSVDAVVERVLGVARRTSVAGTVVGIRFCGFQENDVVAVILW